MNYFHGGNVAVPQIDPYIYGEDDELLCASASINVAKRYGEVITAFTLNDLPVKRMTVKEWFTVDESSKNLVADLRKAGFAAVVVEGDEASFDFPVETVFVLSPEALSFDRVLSEEEALGANDGIPSCDPCGPSACGWDLYLADQYGGDLHEALRHCGWVIFEDGCLRASVPRNKMFREWLGMATPQPDGTCIIETNFCTDRIEMPSVTEALKVLDRWRIEKIEEWGFYMSNDEQWSTGPPLGTWAEDENPLYPMSDWRHEVANEDTRLGYKEWVAHKVECAADDLELENRFAGGASTEETPTTDITDHARSLGYNGPSPVLLLGEKVLSYENKKWDLFREECLAGKHANPALAGLVVLRPLPQFGCVGGVLDGTLLCCPMNRDNSWSPEEMCEVSDPWAGCDKDSPSRDDVALIFLMAVNALLGTKFKLSDFGTPWGDADAHKAAPENA